MEVFCLFVYCLFIFAVVLSSCGLQGLNSGHRAGQQASIPTKPSYFLEYLLESLCLLLCKSIELAACNKSLKL